MNNFDLIKERLTMPQVMERYGIIVKRNTAICPFHAAGQERTPSLHIKPTYFYCFGCSTGGDIIKFIELLFRLSPLEAAKLLNSDFNLGLELDKPPSREEVQRHKRRQALYKAFAEWEKATFNRLCRELHTCNDTISANEPFSDEWCTSIRRKEIIDYHLDTLMYGDFETKHSLYKHLKDGEIIGKQAGHYEQTGRTAAG